MLIDGYGCQECEECVHDLLDTTDELLNLIEPTIVEFKVIKGHFAIICQRIFM